MNPFVPFPTLTTERLVLRELTTDDADALFAVWSDPEVLRFIGRPPDADRAASRARLERVVAALAGGTGIRWGFVHDGVLVGSGGLWRWDKEHHQAELGYDLGSAHWGRGLMPEALRAILGWSFEHLPLHRVEAHIDPDNVRSARVLERLGFSFEGRTRESFFSDGRYSDTGIYGLLRGELRAR